jgi:hypothetical protein
METEEVWLQQLFGLLSNMALGMFLPFQRTAFISKVILLFKLGVRSLIAWFYSMNWFF